MKEIITRTITGIFFLIVLLSGLCINKYLFFTVFSIVAALTVWEFYGLVGDANSRWGTVRKIISTAAGIYLFCASFMYASGSIDTRIFAPYLLFVIFIFISELYVSESPEHIRNWSYVFLGQVYCILPFALLNFINFREQQFSVWPALALFVFVWVNDTGAFLCGSLFGRHHLFERISPHKSWEGFAGGLLLTMIAAWIFSIYCKEWPLAVWLSASVVVVSFGVWGDLVESLLKRTIGVKDTGRILPGHGGMLDRFDSILMAAPAYYVFIQILI
ncbi:MAG: phosphatidate cytidylyltransferase [Tannerellaceae bacterium]|nr:phosphatidate cytidylyltransferase [Tannerellaceae bacterium]